MVLNYKTFRNILQCSQENLKVILSNFLKYKGYEEVINEDGFVYAKGDIPILLVAHLDTVHRQKPSEIYYDRKQGIMWSPQGIGGDDRCGVYGICEILRTHKPSILFTEDEEIGGIGASKAVEKLEKPEVKFMIELDRRGQNDCVFYDCENKDFQEYIKGFGFEKQWGSFSDICILSKAWDLASVNLSIGYQREHTEKEIINVNDMLETCRKVINILDDKDERCFDYQEKKYDYKYTSYYDYLNYSGEKGKPKKGEEADYLWYDEVGFVSAETGYYYDWEQYDIYLDDVKKSVKMEEK